MPHGLIKEYRCPKDNKLLFKGLLVEGEVKIKCRHCKEIHTFAPGNLEEILCFKDGCVNRVRKSE